MSLLHLDRLLGRRVVDDDVNCLRWRERVLVERLEHSLLRHVGSAILRNQITELLVPQESKQFDSRQHAGELLAMLERGVAVQKSFNLVIDDVRGFRGRVVWVALLCVVVDLVQLDDDLVDQLFLVRILVILVHKLEQLDDHVAPQQAIDCLWIAHERIDVLNELVEGPRAALDELLADKGVLLGLEENREAEVQIKQDLCHLSLDVARKEVLELEDLPGKEEKIVRIKHVLEF